jgi:hypothetical protein
VWRLMQKLFEVKLLFLLPLLTLSLWRGALGIAHDEDLAQLADQLPPMQTEFSEEELRAFAGAYVKASEITVEYAPRIGEVQNPDEAARLQREATRAMVEAIEVQQNLDLETYYAIANAVSANPRLGEKIIGFIEQAASTE